MWQLSLFWNHEKLFFSTWIIQKEMNSVTSGTQRNAYEATIPHTDDSCCCVATLTWHTLHTNIHIQAVVLLVTLSLPTLMLYWSQCKRLLCSLLLNISSAPSPPWIHLWALITGFSMGLSVFSSLCGLSVCLALNCMLQVSNKVLSLQDMENKFGLLNYNLASNWEINVLL